MRFGIEHLACLRLCIAPQNVAKTESLDMLPLRVRTRLGSVPGPLLVCPFRVAQRVSWFRDLEGASVCQQRFRSVLLCPASGLPRLSA